MNNAAWEGFGVLKWELETNGAKEVCWNPSQLPPPAQGGTLVMGRFASKTLRGPPILYSQALLVQLGSIDNWPAGRLLLRNFGGQENWLPPCGVDFWVAHEVAEWRTRETEGRLEPRVVPERLWLKETGEASWLLGSERPRKWAWELTRTSWVKDWNLGRVN